MSYLSQEEARQFIAGVREKNGGLTPEDRDYLAANRPSVLRALQNSRRQVANSLKTCIYPPGVRFILIFKASLTTFTQKKPTSYMN